MRQHWTDPAAIEAEIARIRSLPLDALRRRWRVMFGRTPPAALSKDLLGRMMACRLQEQAFGSLDRESLRFLDGLARHGGAPRRQLKPGTVLVRDYQGQRHTVTVAPSRYPGRRRVGTPRHPPPNRDLDAELEQFPVDAGRPPTTGWPCSCGGSNHGFLCRS